ncbi:hypothetical protein [Curtobacterium sp. B8]|uniref:hypothetical protein n=1 Tax=Curtobacterium sp. B8 TaxID=95611 RepID=UPI0011D1F7A8|nr:hypothetical protein [Curtobacterium sp. B8]
MKFFNAKSPTVVIALGAIFAIFGAFYGLSPFNGDARPVAQIVIAVVLVLIGIVFIVQGLGTRAHRKRDGSD